MQGLSFKTRDVVSYAFFPRIVPRIRSVFFSGFGYLAFMMAQLYYTVRLIPANHPYLQTRNIGRFGVYNVITEASNNLRFSTRNIDQIFVFFALLAAIVLLFLQVVLLVYSLLFTSPAEAFSWFTTTAPQNDLAYMILNDVFGVPDVFCDSFAPGTCALNNPVILPGPTTGSPYHNALHELFRYYSVAMLLIAVLIFLYFIFVIVLETAVTGVPFGQRMQHVWVPIRLIIAVILLVPQNFGLNSGQWILLYVAKYGSSFATVGWIQFNTAVAAHPMFGGGITNSNPAGERYSLVAIPQEVDVTPVLRAMSIVHACAFSYMLMTGSATGGAPYPVTADYTAPGTNFMIRPYLVKRSTPWQTAAAPPPLVANPAVRQVINGPAAPNWVAAVGFYYGSDIIIRFGEYAENPPGSGSPKYKNDEGFVAPLCGDIRLRVSDIRNVNNPGVGAGAYMLRYFYEMVLNMWFNDNQLKQFARTHVVVSSRHRVEAATFCTPGLSGCGSAGFQTCANCPTVPPPLSFIGVKMDDPPAPGAYQIATNVAVRTAWDLYVQSGLDKNMENNIIDRGWAGAGIWYNKIAEINSGFIDSVRAIPVLVRFPLVMEQIKYERQKIDVSAFSIKDLYNPDIKPSGGKTGAHLVIDRGDAELDQIGRPLNDLWKFWMVDAPHVQNEELKQQSNAFVDAINLMLGTSGVTHIRGANRHLHPLAQLVAVGKGLVDNAVFNLLVSTGAAFGGGFLGGAEKFKLGQAGLEVVSAIYEVTAFVGLTAGFVLFYVLPFLPFVYFFFAVGSWVKAIFEAMVAIPLWALAHMRIDGEGLPGDAASNGYFLILEIFIRPILTVAGLIAAITILSAQVRVLNFIWDLVIANASGYADADILGTNVATDVRYKGTPIDQFFFTIIYTIICYMLATASFKLIDKIPDNILRWAGAGVSSFGDIDQDHVESLNRYAATGGMTIGSQAVGAVRGAAGGLGQTLGSMVKDEKGAASS